MIILGLDISKLSTGYAIFDTETEKVLTYGLITNPKKLPMGAHLSKFRKSIMVLINTYKADAVVMEDLHMRFLSTGKEILQFHGVAKETGYEFTGDENIAYASQTWRHKLLGIKKFTKDEKDELKKKSRNQTHFKELTSIKQKVIKYVNDRLGTNFKFEDNDVVDAIGLCLGLNDVVKGRV